jgi:hypothetical protein
MNSSLRFNKNGMKLSKNEKNSVFEEQPRIKVTPYK